MKIVKLQRDRDFRIGKISSESTQSYILMNECSWISGEFKILWTEAVREEFFESGLPNSAFSIPWFRPLIRHLWLRIVSRNQKNRHVERTKLAEYLTTHPTGRYGCIHISV